MRLRENLAGAVCFGSSNGNSNKRNRRCILPAGHRLSAQTIFSLTWRIQFGQGPRTVSLPSLLALSRAILAAFLKPKLTGAQAHLLMRETQAVHQEGFCHRPSSAAPPQQQLAQDAKSCNRLTLLKAELARSKYRLEHPEQPVSNQ